MGDVVERAHDRIGLFRVGMRLEAKDRLNPGLICVATITNIKDGQLLIHFDGWSNRYDYWCKPDTPDIHPIGWCDSKGRELQPPKGNKDSSYSLHIQSTCILLYIWYLYLKEQ